MSVRKLIKAKPGEVRAGGCPGVDLQAVLPTAAGQGHRHTVCWEAPEPRLQAVTRQMIPSRAHIINCSLPSSMESPITTQVSFSPHPCQDQVLLGFLNAHHTCAQRTGVTSFGGNYID